MKYHKQKILNEDFGGEKGSCYPTVIACLLDLELIQVPLFNLLYWKKKENINIDSVAKITKLHGQEWEDATESQHDNYSRFTSRKHSIWDDVLQYFLASRGYVEHYIEKEDYNKWLRNHTNQYYMVTGMSPRGVTHVVIYQNGKMVHDPHPSNSGVEIKENQTAPYSYLEKII